MKNAEEFPIPVTMTVKDIHNVMDMFVTLQHMFNLLDSVGVTASVEDAAHEASLTATMQSILRQGLEYFRDNLTPEEIERILSNIAAEGKSLHAEVTATLRGESTGSDILVMPANKKLIVH